MNVFNFQSIPYSLQFLFCVCKPTYYHEDSFNSKRKLLQINRTDLFPPRGNFAKFRKGIGLVLDSFAYYQVGTIMEVNSAYDPKSEIEVNGTIYSQR